MKLIMWICSFLWYCEAELLSMAGGISHERFPMDLQPDHWMLRNESTSPYDSFQMCVLVCRSIFPCMRYEGSCDRYDPCCDRLGNHHIDFLWSHNAPHIQRLEFQWNGRLGRIPQPGIQWTVVTSYISYKNTQSFFFQEQMHTKRQCIPSRLWISKRSDVLNCKYSA